MTRSVKVSNVTDNYPYVVKVVVPTGAWTHPDNMHEFHVRNGIVERYLWHRTAAGDILHWRFPEPSYAEFFIAEFGGDLIASP